MLWRVVCTVVLGVNLGGFARTEESGAAVKQEIEDIFKTVERFMSAKIKPVEKIDSKSAEARAKDKIYVDHEDSDEHDDVDELPVTPRIPLTSREAGMQPVTFPIGIIMADNLYPLVVGKNVDSGRPFVMNLNKQHALVVARAAGGGDYKLLIPFPVMVGSHPGQEHQVYNDEPSPGYRNFPTPMSGHLRHHPVKYRSRKPLHGPYIAERPSKFRFHDLSEEVSSRPKEYAQNYQSYRQYSGEDHGSGEFRTGKLPPHVGKKYSKPQSYKNVKPRPGKEFNPSSLERPDIAVRGYNRVYPKSGISYAVAGPKPNLPRKNIPMAYRQSQSGLYQHRNQNYNPYPSPTPRYPAYQAAPPPPHKSAALYPPTNYAGAYASVPKDFKPSPYLGNITEDPEPYTGAQPQGDHYESYDDRPYEFSEQDYLDSLNSPDAHSSSGGVHHVTYHVDDYLGKIYEEMYYRLPPPPPPSPSDNDRQGTQEFPSANYGVKVTTFSSRNKTETPRPKTESVSFQEVKQTNANNKHNVKKR